MSYQDIPAAEVDELLRTEQPIVIDQRDAQSRSKGQLPNAVAASDAVINTLMRQRRNNPAVLVYCYHGNQSHDLCSFLGQLGLNTLQRQKAILALFKDDISNGDLHALSITARSPQEQAGQGDLVQITL